MGKSIKAKSKLKDIKILDKNTVASQRMKRAYICIKDKADHGMYAKESSTDEYASNQLSSGTDHVIFETLYQLDKQGRKGVCITKETISTAKEKNQTHKAAAEQPKKQTTEQAARHVKTEVSYRSQQQITRTSTGPPSSNPPEFSLPRLNLPGTDLSGFNPPGITLQTSNLPEITQSNSIATSVSGHKKKVVMPTNQSQKVGRLAPPTIKASIKTTDKAIKTSGKSTTASIRTTQQATQSMYQAGVAAVRTVKAAAHATRTAAIATAHAAKSAARATVTAVNAIVAATKALLTAIAAGGWVAMLVIIIICLIGLIAASPFGVFFSGEDTGTGQTVRTAMEEINAAYQERLDGIKADHPYDVLEMSGSRALWKEVLAVYAVRTATDPDNARDVAAMDSERLELLKDIFWQMHEITFSTGTRTELVVEETDDGASGIVETETSVTRTYLHITVSHKTLDEMADRYAFDQDQRDMLAELLDDENNRLWLQALYGITEGDGDLVAVSLSQLGNVGGEPYWSWYGFSSHVDWCACFVSWCANECGYIEAGVIPRFAGCILGSNWFKERGLWQDGGYEPRPGDIIFFDWEGEGLADHVGIVERVESSRIYTVEGNSGDACRRKSYPMDSAVIYGFGCPAY